MKRSFDLDDELLAAVDKTASRLHEKPATLLRLAIRVGIPSVANRFQAPHPEGYFSDVYRQYPKEWMEFEERMAKATIQSPER
jgi:hypothetical protein